MSESGPLVSESGPPEVSESGPLVFESGPPEVSESGPLVSESGLAPCSVGRRMQHARPRCMRAPREGRRGGFVRLWHHQQQVGDKEVMQEEGV